MVMSNTVDMEKFNEKCKNVLRRNGRSFLFTDTIVEDNYDELMPIAEYIMYDTSNPILYNQEWIADVRRQVDKGISDFSIGHARGILNWYINRIKDAQFKKSGLPVMYDVKAKNDDYVINLEEITRPKVTQVVENSFYTIIFNNDSDDYVTLRLSDCKYDDMPENTQIASYLSGPENTVDYTGFAFVLGDEIRIWKRFDPNSKISEALRILIESDDFGAYGQAYADTFKRCRRCGKVLTVPASLHRGLGPECAKILGYM